MNDYSIALLEPISMQHILMELDTHLPFSHDQNIIEFAKFLAKKGQRVYLTDYLNPLSSKLTITFNEDFEYNLEKKVFKNLDFCDFVFTTKAEAMPDRNITCGAKTLAFQPAVFFAEMPEETDPHHVAGLIEPLRKNIDFIITQNQRMKEMFFLLYSTLAGWRNNDHILLAPLGPSELLFNKENYEETRRNVRNEFGISETDILIINAGGFWRWTDLDTFMNTFLSFIKANRNSRLYFCQPSFSQSSNSDHDKFINEVKQNIKLLPGDLQNRIIEIGDWHDAAKRIPELLCAADIGINVNPSSLENYLSHRVRVTEYLSGGLPIINTKGDWLEECGKAFCFFVESGNHESYLETLELINNSNGLHIQKMASRKMAAQMQNGTQYSQILEAMEIANPLVQRSVSAFQIWASLNTSKKENPITFLKIYFNRLVPKVKAKPKLYKILLRIGVRKIYRAINSLIK